MPAPGRVAGCSGFIGINRGGLSVAALRAVIRYLVAESGAVFRPQLTQLVYLSDWAAARTLGRQLTLIRWSFNHYAPFVEDVILTAMRDPALRVRDITSAWGMPGSRIDLAGSRPHIRLIPEDRFVLDQVVREVSGLSWTAFVAHVHSTYPLRTQGRGAPLDLVRLAAAERTR